MDEEPWKTTWPPHSERELETCPGEKITLVKERRIDLDFADNNGSLAKISEIFMEGKVGAFTVGKMRHQGWLQMWTGIFRSSTVAALQRRQSLSWRCRQGHHEDFHFRRNASESSVVSQACQSGEQMVCFSLR